MLIAWRRKEREQDNIKSVTIVLVLITRGFPTSALNRGKWRASIMHKPCREDCVRFSIQLLDLQSDVPSLSQWKWKLQRIYLNLPSFPYAAIIQVAEILFLYNMTVSYVITDATAHEEPRHQWPWHWLPSSHVFSVSICLVFWPIAW